MYYLLLTGAICGAAQQSLIGIGAIDGFGGVGSIFGIGCVGVGGSISGIGCMVDDNDIQGNNLWAAQQSLIRGIIPGADRPLQYFLHKL